MSHKLPGDAALVALCSGFVGATERFHQGPEQTGMKRLTSVQNEEQEVGPLLYGQ